MSLTRIGPKHQITIPKEVFEELKLEVGDYLEVVVRNGKGLIVPKKLVEKAPVPKLTSAQQRALKSARAKIEAINKEPGRSQGLTGPEIKIAAKVGLIDPEQAWYWTEEWQKGEREAEKDIRTDKVESFDSLDELLDELKK